MIKLPALFVSVLLLTACGESPKEINKIPESDPDAYSAPGSVDTLRSETISLRTDMSFPPVDESSLDKTLQQFVQRLKVAVTKQDSSTFFSMLDKDVVVSWGGGAKGQADLIREWGLDTPQAPDVWKRISERLSYGGAWDEDEEFGKCCVMPYYQCNRLLNNYSVGDNWFSVIIALKPDVPLRSKPDGNSEIKKHLHYSLLEITDMKQLSADYVPVKVPNTDIEGYVNQSDIEFLADGAFYISKVNGQWKIVSVAPFD